MSEKTWKLEKDLCRCCLSEGAFQNLAEPCSNQGEEEIYSDMLMESFDLNVSTHLRTFCVKCGALQVVLN